MTERLVLRKPEAADLDAYVEMWSDPEVVRFLGGEVAGRKETAAGIERMLGHWERHGVGLFTVVRKEDERIVGRTGFLLWEGLAERCSSPGCDGRRAARTQGAPIVT